MIHIVSGNDSAKKNKHLKMLAQDNERIYLRGDDASKDVIFNYATSANLFGDTPVVILENIIEQGGLSLGAKDLEILQDSSTTFIFLEDKFLKKDESKYKKYATILTFEEKIIKPKQSFDTFSVAESYGHRDKIGTWVLYRDAIEKGVEPEAISGILFWRIKTMILNKTKIFTLTELKNQSKNLVSLYHRAHLGKLDFTIGLEQFILSSLSK